MKEKQHIAPNKTPIIIVVVENLPRKENTKFKTINTGTAKIER